MMEEHAPDTLMSGSDSDHDDDDLGHSGSDVEGAAHHYHASKPSSQPHHSNSKPHGASLTLSIPNANSETSPGRALASPVQPHSGKSQPTIMSRLGTKPRPDGAPSLPPAPEHFQFNYDLNEDVERLLDLEDELGHEVELTGLDQGWEDGNSLHPRLRGTNPGSEGGARAPEGGSPFSSTGGQHPASPTLPRLVLRRNLDGSQSGNQSGMLSQFGSRHTTATGMADDEPMTPGTPAALSHNLTRTSVPKLSFANLRTASTTSITSFKLLSSSLPFKTSPNSKRHSSLAPPLTASPMACAPPRPSSTRRGSHASTGRSCTEDSPRKSTNPMPTMANSTAFASMLSPKRMLPAGLTAHTGPSDLQQSLLNPSAPGQLQPAHQELTIPMLSARGLLSHRAPSRMPPLPSAVAAAAASHLPSSPTGASARANAAAMGLWGPAGPAPVAQVFASQSQSQSGAASETHGAGVAEGGSAGRAVASGSEEAGGMPGVVLSARDISQARSIPMLNLSVLKKGEREAAWRMALACVAQV